MFDVLADRASTRVENNADIVVGFALRNPEQPSASRGVSCNDINALRMLWWAGAIDVIFVASFLASEGNTGKDIRT